MTREQCGIRIGGIVEKWAQKNRINVADFFRTVSGLPRKSGGVCVVLVVDSSFGHAGFLGFVFRLSNPL